MPTENSERAEKSRVLGWAAVVSPAWTSSCFPSFRFDAPMGRAIYYDSVVRSTIDADGRLSAWTAEPPFKSGRSGAAAARVVLRGCAREFQNPATPENARSAPECTTIGDFSLVRDVSVSPAARLLSASAQNPGLFGVIGVLSRHRTPAKPRCCERCVQREGQNGIPAGPRAVPSVKLDAGKGMAGGTSGPSTDPWDASLAGLSLHVSLCRF